MNPDLRDCPACGKHTPHTRLFEVNRCQILRCNVCGIGRTDAASFHPAAYYTEEYFQGGVPDGYSNYVETESVLRREFGSLVEIIRKVKPSGKLLEIGCAYGFFLKEASRFYKAAGLEVSADAVAACLRAGLNVRRGMLDTSTLRDFGKFDVIVMLDVIEHLPNPAHAMQLIADHLAPGGLVVSTTGDFSSLLSRLLGRRWRLMTPPQHLWFFTPSSLTKLAERYGLRVASIKYPWKLVPVSLAIYQLQRILGMNTKTRARLGLGIPVNLHDAMRILMTKADETDSTA